MFYGAVGYITLGRIYILSRARWNKKNKKYNNNIIITVDLAVANDIAQNASVASSETDRNHKAPPDAERRNGLQENVSSRTNYIQ